MVRLLKLGKAKRQKRYYTTHCTWCNSKLVFEYDDVWVHSAHDDIWRISCPVCRTKIFLEPCITMTSVVQESDEETYNNARIDVSKSGLEMLAEEKEKIENEYLSEHLGGDADVVDETHQ